MSRRLWQFFSVQLMRTFYIVVISAVLGLAAGIGTSWAKLGRAPDFTEDFDLLTSAVRKPSQPTVPSGPQPRVSVEADEHDFGTVERNHSVEHAFRFTNTGQAPLELKSGGTSCGKCTISKIRAAPILPGETAEVVVQYNASIESAQFRQSATILTNDLLTPRVALTVSGKVASSYSILPAKLVFSKLAAGEAKTAELTVISYVAEQFVIHSSTFADPDTAAFFDAQIMPIPSDELGDPEAKCGYTVSVTIKPGMPLGPVRQSLVLKTDLPGSSELEVPIEGSIDSDITIAGQGWEREHGVLLLGVVRSSEGIKRELHLLVRGQQRHELQISVGKNEPDYLHARLGQPTDVNGGAVVRIPLIIEIAPGEPDANHMGKWGQITLETTHSEAKQIRLFVRFAVEH